MKLVSQVQILLKYLPHCEKENQKFKILVEVTRLRREIVRVEEMTFSEKIQEVPKKILLIDSKLNIKLNKISIE